MDTTEIFVAVLLLLIGGVCGWITTRVTKIADDLSDTRRQLAVALNNIDHLTNKTATHTNHIDSLFEMKTAIVSTQAELKVLSETLPQVMAVMQQLVTLIVRNRQNAA